jgi:hypothetical protein
MESLKRKNPTEMLEIKRSLKSTKKYSLKPLQHTSRRQNFRAQRLYIHIYIYI